jgi:uncharacterized protein YecE (DUF72 family)
VLYQLPPHWHCNLDRLRKFLAVLPGDVQHVIEFRDPSWYNDDVRVLLAESGVGFCIHDLRGLPCPRWVTGPLVYLRFHGPTQKAYDGRYPLDDLQKSADAIATYRDAGHDVYAYFNNDDRGYAVANARELRTLLQGEPVARVSG